ncbi:MAG: alpha/beta fold hydrolase [Defluviitaleaceae bacterium]|nr:alpha/beta fold hydrolase [Defluviitaleaceae bacterium]
MNHPENSIQDNVNVIIHGFGGTTNEITYLQEYLDKQGINTHTIVLAGHGGTKRDLHKTSHMDWIKSAETEISKLRDEYSKINLIGFSMGGLISANLSALFKIDKIVFINTPIYLWNLKISAKNIITDLRSGGMEYISFFRDSVSKVSPKSGIDFLRFLRKAKRVIKSVQSKCIILQCTEDETVHYRSAKYLKDKLGEKALLRYYKGGCHNVFLNATDIRDSFCDDIYHFLI